MFTSPYRFDYCTATTLAWDIPQDGKNILVVAGIIRADEPFKDKLAVPGGFKENETLEECAARELKEETHAIVNPKDVRLVVVQSDPNRDPRTLKTKVPVIDHFYHVWTPLKKLQQMVADDDADSKAGIQLVQYDQWKSMPTRESLMEQWAFDHGDSIWRFMHQIEWLPKPKTEIPWLHQAAM